MRQQTSETNKVLLILMASIAALVFFIYLPVLGFEYVWDDRALFLDSPVLRVVSDVGGWWGGVSRPILPGTTYFRPAVLSTFVIEFWGNKTDPALSHAVNLLVFVSNVLLVGVLAYLISLRFSASRRLMAVAISMGVYGFHPANVEATAWVAGRFDLLVTFWALLLLVVDRIASGPFRWIAVALCYFLAATSKEMAMVIPCAYCFFRVFFFGQENPALTAGQLFRFTLRDKAFRGGVLAILVAGAVYMVLRVYAMHQVAHVDQYLNKRLGLFEHVVFVFRALWFYMQSSVWPFFDVSVQHPLAPDDLSGPDFFLAAMAVILLLGMMIGCWRGGDKYQYEFGLVCLAVLSLAPVLHIIPLTIGGNIGHERFLTLPLCFFSLAVGRYFSQWLTVPTLVRGGVLVVLGLWLTLAVANISAILPAWRDDVTLWSWAYKQHPDTPYVQASLVSALFKRGQYGDAEAVAGQVLARRASHPPLDVLLVSAQIDLANKRNDIAVQKMLAVVGELESPKWQRKYLGEGGDAERMKGIRRHVDGLLSGAYLANGNVESGLFYARRAANQLPQSPNADLNLARAEYFAGNWSEGQQAFARALMGVSGPDKAGILRTRDSFISGLCRDVDVRYEKLCEQWRLEKK